VASVDALTTSIPWRRIALVAGAVVAAAMLAWALGLYDALRLQNLARVRTWVQDLGPLGPVVFIVGYVAAELLFVPALPLTLFGGLAFGPLWGTVWVSAGATLGAAAAFLVARHAARGLVEAWVARSPRLRRLDGAVARHGWRILMITRLVPVFPFTLQNFAYGLTRIGFWSYVLVSWVCMLPGTVAYVLAGAALSDAAADPRRTLAWLAGAAVLVVALSLVPGWLRRRSRLAGQLLRAK
jgi:uncharacterized membrane protein YdjX (TVP38/TMEM64 family)